MFLKRALWSNKSGSSHLNRTEQVPPLQESVTFSKYATFPKLISLNFWGPMQHLLTPLGTVSEMLVNRDYNSCGGGYGEERSEALFFLMFPSLCL